MICCEGVPNVLSSLLTCSQGVVKVLSRCGQSVVKVLSTWFQRLLIRIVEKQAKKYFKSV